MQRAADFMFKEMNPNADPGLEIETGKTKPPSGGQEASQEPAAARNTKAKLNQSLLADVSQSDDSSGSGD